MTIAPRATISVDFGNSKMVMFIGRSYGDGIRPSSVQSLADAADKAPAHRHRRPAPQQLRHLPPPTGCPSTPAPTWRCSGHAERAHRGRPLRPLISWSRTRTASRSSRRRPRSTRPSGPRRSSTSRPRPSRSLPAHGESRSGGFHRVVARASSAVRTRTRSTTARASHGHQRASGLLGREGRRADHVLAEGRAHRATPASGAREARCQAQSGERSTRWSCQRPAPTWLRCRRRSRVRSRACSSTTRTPAKGYAQPKKWTEALEKTDLVVTIDVQMSETAQQSDYVLPECTYLERMELPEFIGGKKHYVACARRCSSPSTPRRSRAMRSSPAWPRRAAWASTSRSRWRSLQPPSSRRWA